MRPLRSPLPRSHAEGVGGVQADLRPAGRVTRAQHRRGAGGVVAKDDPLNAYNREGAKDGRPNLTKQAMTQPRVR